MSINMCSNDKRKTKHDKSSIDNVNHYWFCVSSILRGNVWVFYEGTTFWYIDNADDDDGDDVNVKVS